MENIKEFKTLIEKYKLITEEHIMRVYRGILTAGFDATPIMKNLTGFGYTYTCTLCNAVNDDCNKCVWYHINKPIENIVSTDYPCLGDTYDGIERAESPQELLAAIADRVEFMEEKLKQYEEARNS